MPIYGGVIYSPADKYVRAIRNPVKKQYASAYSGYLRTGNDKPERPAGLSVMAAQAVEMRLRQLI